MKLLLVLLSILVMLASAQVPIPNRPDGYNLGKGPASSPVVIDAFFDLLCPDSQAAWPVIKQVIDHYQSNLYFLLHTFPLPYHTNSFIANQGLHVIDHATSHNTSALLAYTDLLFDQQASFYNAPTINHTINEVIQALARLTEKSNIVNAKTFLSGIANGDINEETRISWKYACSRSIVGTPTFLLNGVQISADATWTLSDWKSVIDPLIKSYEKMERHWRRESVSFVSTPLSSSTTNANATCPAGQTLCAYAPHKSACCLKGENCIPNVGCRCLTDECAVDKQM